LWIWYIMMVCITIFNVNWYLRTVVSYLTLLLPATSRSILYRRCMLVFGGFYVLGCGLRTILPRVDVERSCLYPGFLSTIFVGRSFATVAEVSFMTQLCWAMYQFASDLQRYALEVASHSASSFSLFPIRLIRTVCVCIVLANPFAQCLCWCGITTTRQLWHVYEQSIWTVSVALLTLCACYLVFRCSWPTSQSASFAERMLIFFILGGPLFVAFMVFNDIPMYYNRWLQNESDHVSYFTFLEGLKDSMSCKMVTQKWSDWAEDIPWMTGYFSVCVWVSIVLAAAPGIDFVSPAQDTAVDTKQKKNV